MRMYFVQLRIAPQNPKTPQEFKFDLTTTKCLRKRELTQED